jgi:hypothetical protein
MIMQNFEQASERYKNACAMMELKEKLKREVPPIGSAFYRYFSDPNSNPPSHHTLIERIDNMSLAKCKEYSMFDYYYSVAALAIQ